MTTKLQIQIGLALAALSTFYFLSGDFIEKRYHGEYVTGFEANVFHPCGIKQRWWVESDSVALFHNVFSDFEVPQGMFEVKSLYVEWVGKKGFMGSYGHLGISQRKLRVTKIVKVKKYEKECGER